MSSQITSKVSVKSQTVIPLAVRQHLHIQAGDELEYELMDGAVVMRPKHVSTALGDDPFATFTEWSSQADEDAYGDL
ncbi:AbrB/MazE/SpoVT family DNA-binding domain-containing protein [Terasakiella sp.]|uniref:AbrB/MazE/SpoVT family DNA-binding domain-containing protein n=1 Tax=Terasakiella sp. TaxID=2034861 RepID=UPI003AA8D9D6